MRDCLSLTVSFDHRMIDAAPAARFTERLKELIESGYGLAIDEEAIAEPITRQRVPQAVAPTR
jgi:2-oxoacid dehydrogenases acyltransferase (catalytic domain)